MAVPRGLLPVLLESFQQSSLPRAALALVLTAALACAQRKLDTGPEGSSGALAPAHSAARRSAPSDAELDAAIDDKSWRFSDGIERDPSRWSTFVRFGQTATAPHRIAAVLAALTRLQTQGTQADATGDATGDATALSALVVQHLDNTHPRVQARALELAKSLLRSSRADKELTAALVERADEPQFDDGPARHALLEALRETKTPLRTAAWYQVFLDSLLAREPYVTLLASDALLDALPGLTDRSGLQAAGLLLLESESPLLRGKGVDIVGSTLRAAPDIVPEVYTLLDDPSPFVRSKACFALARMKHRQGIHGIVRLLDDTSDNALHYELPTLEGAASTHTLNGSPWGSVQDAAVSALRVLSRGGFELLPSDPRNAAALTSQNAQSARAWYLAHASELPFDQHR